MEAVQTIQAPPSHTHTTCGAVASVALRTTTPSAPPPFLVFSQTSTHLPTTPPHPILPHSTPFHLAHLSGMSPYLGPSAVGGTKKVNRVFVFCFKCIIVLFQYVGDSGTGCCSICGGYSGCNCNKCHQHKTGGYRCASGTP